MCVRKLIIIACIAALLVTVVVAVAIDVSPFVPEIAAITVRHSAAHADVQRPALFAHAHLRAPPA